MAPPSTRAPRPPEFEVPDLVLESPPKPVPGRPLVERRQSGAHAIGARAGSNAHMLSDDFELALSEGQQPLELESGSSGGPSPLARDARVGAPGTNAFGADSFGANAFGADSFGAAFELEAEAMILEPVAVTDTTPWPRGRHEGSIDVAPSAVTAAAGYGSAAVPFYLAPAYTVRVLLRQRALKLELQTASSELGAREAERDRVLGGMVARQRPSLEANERFHELMLNLDRAERDLSAERQRLAEVNQALSQQLDAADQELARLEAERVKQGAALAEASARHASARREAERWGAKLKRIEIEERNVRSQARALLGPEGGALPEELAKKLEALEQQRQALSPTHLKATSELGALEAPLAECQTRVARTAREMDGVRAARRASIDKYQARVDSNHQALEAAETEATLVVRQIAYAVLDLRGTLPVPRETLLEIKTADERVFGAMVEVERRTRALDAYDRSCFMLGFKVASAPIVLGLVLALLSALL